jgi:hypothetical protein
MFLKYAPNGGLTLEDRDNFRAFKLVIAAERNRLDDIRRDLAGEAELVDAETAWIFAEPLRRRSGVIDDATWQQNFSAMIEKARPHGWIDDERRAIKAHVEWLPA